MARLDLTRKKVPNDVLVGSQSLITPKLKRLILTQASLQITAIVHETATFLCLAGDLLDSREQQELTHVAVMLRVVLSHLDRPDDPVIVRLDLHNSSDWPLPTDFLVQGGHDVSQLEVVLLLGPLVHLVELRNDFLAKAAPEVSLYFFQLL